MWAFVPAPVGSAGRVGGRACGSAARRSLQMWWRDTNCGRRRLLPCRRRLTATPLALALQIVSAGLTYAARSPREAATLSKRRLVDKFAATTAPPPGVPPARASGEVDQCPVHSQ